MLRSAIENRALAFLRASILIATRNPTGLLVPAVFSGNTVSQALLALILWDLCLQLSIDQRREVQSEMHGRHVVGGTPPAKRLVTLMRCGKSGRMIFRQVVTDFVHIRHQKKADGSERLIAD